MVKQNKMKTVVILLSYMYHIAVKFQNLQIKALLLSDPLCCTMNCQRLHQSIIASK